MKRKNSLRGSVVTAVLAVMSLGWGACPILAVDGGINTAPVTYYDPDTGQTTPFFPVGWWVNARDLTMSRMIKAAKTGANTILLDGVGDSNSHINDVGTWLDFAVSENMKLVLSFDRPYLNADGLSSTASHRAPIADYINAYKNHPALLGYNLGDENALSGLDPVDVTAAASLVHSLDPNRPVWQVFAGSLNADDVSSYLPGTNVVQSDKYEHRETSFQFRHSDRYLNSLHRFTNVATSIGASYVNTPQGFGTSPFRDPTPAEHRWDIFSAIASGGARGTLNWTWQDDEDRSSNYELSDFSKNTIIPVTAEQLQLKHAMETGYRVGQVSLSWSPGVGDSTWGVFKEFDQISQLLLFDDQANKYYLLATNNGAGTRDIDITISDLPEKLAELQVVIPKTGETGLLQDLGGGRFGLSDTLDNYEVVIYELSALPEPATGGLFALAAGMLVVARRTRSRCYEDKTRRR